MRGPARVLLVVAFSLAGCSVEQSSGAPSESQQAPSSSVVGQATALTNWFKGNLGSIQTLQNDLDNITTAGNSGDEMSILSGCQQLGVDASAAERLPPIPDPTFQGEWAASLADFASASRDCINGLQNGDVNLASQYKAEINNGIREQAKIASALGG